MRHLIARDCCQLAALALIALLPALAADAPAVTIDWSFVGDAGNAGKSTVDSVRGAVAYNYYIGTYLVTNSQYVEFLNAKDPTGTNMLGLYNPLYLGWIGIDNGSTAPDGNKYSVVPGSGNHPVNWVNSYSALRFANWLNNGQGPDADTETGAYTLGGLDEIGIPVNGGDIVRNAGATVFLPSVDEWYKAAYFNPATDSYYQYPTSSDTLPIASGPTAIPNSANYIYAVNDLTDVGAYSGTRSAYGAYDMAGNVRELTETLSYFSPSRVIMGGSFNDSYHYLLATFGENSVNPSIGYPNYGFRMATIIPEPATITLAAFGVAVLAACGLRRRTG